MMFRVFSVIVLSLTCAINFAAAADLPFQVESITPIHTKKPLRSKKVAAKPKNTKVKSLVVATVPVAPDPVIKSTTPVLADSPVVPDSSPLPDSTEVYVSWVLDPLVANADGGKTEGSASASVKIVVGNPGAPYGPEMVIVLDGHVIKTARSTVRLDIQIGSIRRSVVWNDGEIKAGKFKISLNEIVPAGVLPDSIDASAIAFVTKEGEGHVAMVSLEKVVLKRGTSPVIGAQ
jgi:hypothetical protein